MLKEYKYIPDISPEREFYFLKKREHLVYHTQGLRIENSNRLIYKNVKIEGGFVFPSHCPLHFILSHLYLSLIARGMIKLS